MSTDEKNRKESSQEKKKEKQFQICMGTVSDVPSIDKPQRDLRGLVSSRQTEILSQKQTKLKINK